MWRMWLGGDATVVKNLDQFADVPGSGRLFGRGLDDADGAVQAELVVAKKFEGETVTELGAKPVGVDGDIDVVTSVRAYEVKAGNPSNLDIAKFETQIKKLVDFARANGKTPVCAFKATFLPLPQNVGDLLRNLRVVVETF